MIIDSTLRDGSHAMSHQFNTEQIQMYARGAEMVGMPILVVGHGNGLGASSLQLGMSRLSDRDMLITAKKELKNTKLGAFLIPGFGTIKRDIKPAIETGIDILIIGSHCTEANTTRQHIEYGITHGLKVYAVLMMTHMAEASVLLEQAQLLEKYGAQGVLLMDSAGAYVMDDVREKVGLLASKLTVPIGFHPHNNLGLAVANAVVAVQSGATIIDGTVRGLGAGAGNVPLEVIVAVLGKMGYKIGLDFYKLLDLSTYMSEKIMDKAPEINPVTLVGGLAGVFSGFAPHAIKASAQFGVDVRDILMELGKRKVVAGQEDIIVDVAMNLKQKKEKQNENFALESLT